MGEEQEASVDSRTASKSRTHVSLSISFLLNRHLFFDRALTHSRKDVMLAFP